MNDQNQQGPVEPPPGQQPPAQPPPGAPPPPGGPVQPPGAPPPPPGQRPPQNTDALITWGWICAVVGFLGFCCCCCPSALGLVAIILGAVAYSRGDQRGLWVIIAGAVALVVGNGLSFSLGPVLGPMLERWVPELADELEGPWRGI